MLQFPAWWWVPTKGTAPIRSHCLFISTTWCPLQPEFRLGISMGLFRWQPMIFWCDAEKQLTMWPFFSASMSTFLRRAAVQVIRSFLSSCLPAKETFQGVTVEGCHIQSQDIGKQWGGKFKKWIYRYHTSWSSYQRPTSRTDMSAKFLCYADGNVA